MMEIRLLVNARNVLGEGPLWDVEEQKLYWIDSLAPALQRCNADGSAIEHWPLPAHIGSMALRMHGGAVLSLANGFHRFDFATGMLTPIVDPEPQLDRTRLNDGKVDRRGRFVVGSMDYAECDAICGLYRLDPDLSCTRLDDGIIVSNGPCWSPDNRTFYFADTWKDVIYAYDYDLDQGEVANRRVFASTLDQSGSPDGSTVDSEGYLWNARVTAGRIYRYAPDGRIDRVVDMPVKNVTSVMFGGPQLDVLYVTSMARLLPGQDELEPEAGGLFAVYGLGVKGLPESRFAG